MSALTKEFFEQQLAKQSKEFQDFTEEKIGEVVAFLSDKVAHKDDVSLLATKDEMRRGFTEQSMKLDFIQANFEVLRKDLAALSKALSKNKLSNFILSLPRLWLKKCSA